MKTLRGIKTARLIQKLQKLEWSTENPQRNAIKKLTRNIPNKTLEFFLLFRKIHIFASLIQKSKSNGTQHNQKDPERSTQALLEPSIHGKRNH